jgi:uncharacterized protein YbjT (DUF2867 family)
MLILVTGATGYIGGRLVPKLLEANLQVRCLARDPSRLQGRTWFDQVEVVQGNLLDADSLDGIFNDVDIVFYLIHSMGGGANFHERDLVAADAFGKHAKAAGVQRIIYLGGLGDPESKLSDHLQSRQQTGEKLRNSGIPVTEFRAGVVVGSGSLSFEIIRYLTERVPVMICPRWVYTRAQPISIANVLEYLVQSIFTSESAGRIIEIGGKDVLTYGEMIKKYAHVRGLTRWLIPVPVLTPRLSSYWVHLITPIPANLARPLIDGLKNEVVVIDPCALKIFPEITLDSYEVAVEAALAQLQAGEVETVWSDALLSSQGDHPPVIMTSQEGMILEQRVLKVNSSPSEVFTRFCGLGGQHGWLYMNWAWRIRGLMDWMVGGVGMRRGRRDPNNLRVGDALDFWRVEAVEENKMVRLRAEMKVPGEAWLEFLVNQDADGDTWLFQNAYFAPKGFWGWIYWYALYPIHSLIFSGMINKIASMNDDGRIL